MLSKTETNWMVIAIAGIVYFVSTIVSFICCKIRNITCCHKTHQENSTEEPKYDYAITGEISRCTGNESQKSQEESLDHKEGNTNKNETETTKKADEPVVINDTKVKRKEKTNAKRPIKRTYLKSGTVHYENETVNTSVKKKEKANANRPNKRTCLKSGTVHYENETVDTSVKKANDDNENENVSDTSVQMRKTKSASDQYENEGAIGSSNERYGNESNLYESVHDMPHKMMTAVDIDIEANSDDCMATSDKGISDNMSHIKLNTDRDILPTSNSNDIKNREKEHSERLEKRDSYSKRESQGSGQSNESRKSDESEESNDSRTSRSTDISVRSDNTPRESAPSTNPSQDSCATYINFYAKI